MEGGDRRYRKKEGLGGWMQDMAPTGLGVHHMSERRLAHHDGFHLLGSLTFWTSPITPCILMPAHSRNLSALVDS